MSKPTKEEVLTYELASDLFSYHEDGYLVWNNPRNKVKKKGQRVGGKRKDGRSQVMLLIGDNKYSFLCYRIIWLLHHKKWPESTIDHINGDSSDDRISNLRDISSAINNQNRYVPMCINKTGVLGVSLHKTSGKYRASIKLNGKQTHLGLFDNVEDAEKAYLSKKKEIHIDQVRKQQIMEVSGYAKST